MLDFKIYTEEQFYSDEHGSFFEDNDITPDYDFMDGNKMERFGDREGKKYIAVIIFKESISYIWVNSEEEAQIWKEGFVSGREVMAGVISDILEDIL